MRCTLVEFERRRVGLGIALSLPLYGLLAVILFWPVWRSPVLTSIGFGPDPRLFMWNLGWMPFALSHGLNPFVTNYLDYPDGINLLWSNSAPLLTALLAPLTMTRGVVFAYNAAITAAVALSAWTAFLLIQRFVRRPIAAFAGGLIYGFSPFVLAHALSQPHLVTVVLPPLIFLILHEVLVVQRGPVVLLGGLLGLVAAAQLLMSEEILATTALTSLVAVVLIAAIRPAGIRPRVRYAVVALGTAACTSILLSIVPLAIQFLGPQHVDRTANPLGFYVSDALGFIIPGPLQWLAPEPAQVLSRRFTGNIAEWHAYLGLPLLGVMFWISYRLWERPLVKVVGLLTLVIALLSLGQTVHVAGEITPLPVGLLAAGFFLMRKRAPARVLVLTFVGLWLGLSLVPVLSSAWPARLMVYVFLFAGLLLAIFLDHLVASSARARAAAVVICASVFLTLAPALPFASSPVPVPDFFTAAIRERVPEGSVVLIAPYAYVWDDQAMVWQAAARMWFRMPEGYGTLPGPVLHPAPGALGTLMMRIDQGAMTFEGLTDPVRDQLRADLARWHVQAVVVGPMEHQADMRNLFRDLLEREPESTGGIYLWAHLTPSLEAR